MTQAPQHPGNAQTPQQGLGTPQGQTAPNPYHRPNASLQQATDRITGVNNLKLAQAQEAGAMAGKAQAEADILNGLGELAQAEIMNANQGLGLV